MFQEIQDRIHKACERAGRNPEDIKLVAVTKNHSVAEIQKEILSHNHRILGENRIQEWRDKAAELETIEWHLIGSLQRNKVKYCLPFHLIHSVNSERLIDELERVGSNKDHVFNILIEVNVAAEASKRGAGLDEAEKLVDYAQNKAHLKVKGLMTMAPYSTNSEDARPYFEKLHSIHDKLMLDELSMGMSGDFEIAIEEGATIIRVGSALFPQASLGG